MAKISRIEAKVLGDTLMRVRWSYEFLTLEM